MGNATPGPTGQGRCRVIVRYRASGPDRIDPCQGQLLDQADIGHRHPDRELTGHLDPYPDPIGRPGGQLSDQGIIDHQEGQRPDLIRAIVQHKVKGRGPATTVRKESRVPGSR